MKNLVKLYERADRSGISWYFEAHNFCADLSKRYNVPLANVCAVVSALSPATNWEQNKRDAVRLIQGKEGGYVTYGQNVIKAKIALKTDNPGNLFSMQTGAKTYNFYHCLLSPSSSAHVVIDRHAYRVATGKEYTKLTLKQYLEIASHYMKAANKLGLLPSQLQAVLWVDYRIKQDIKFNIDIPF